MEDLTPESEPAGPPAFARDTTADKVARFGCGAILGVLVAMGLFMTGLLGVLEPFGVTGAVIGAAGLIIGAGVTCLAFGDPAIQMLWKLIKWLA